MSAFLAVGTAGPGMTYPGESTGSGMYATTLSFGVTAGWIHRAAISAASDAMKPMTESGMAGSTTTPTDASIETNDTTSPRNTAGEVVANLMSACFTYVPLESRITCTTDSTTGRTRTQDPFDDELRADPVACKATGEVVRST